MKRTQRERTAQAAAVRWLAVRYAEEAPDARVCFQTEARVRPHEKWGGRADGAIAVRYADRRVKTIAVEVKSVRTRAQLHGRPGCGLMLVGATALLIIASGVSGWLLWNRIGGWASTPLALLIGAFTAGVFGRWASDSPFFVSHEVLTDQLARYPGDERWLVVTADYLSRYPAHGERLANACRRAGVGLISVARRRACSVVVEAARAEPGDRLALYEDSALMLASLDCAKSGMPLDTREE